METNGGGSQTQATGSQDAKQLILRSRKEAAACMDRIRTANPLTFDVLDHEIRGFIGAKYHLEPEDWITDDFQQLAKISMSKSMKISPELVREFDLAKTCDGGTSTSAKMSLLLRAIEKELDITITANQIIKMNTVTELNEFIWIDMGYEPAGLA